MTPAASDLPSYVRVLYRGYSYGPLNVPTKLRIICNGLRISEKAVPALVRINEFEADMEAEEKLYTENASNSSEEYTRSVVSTTDAVTDFEASIDAGLYRLVVAFPDMPFVDEDEIIIAESKGYKDTRSFATQTIQSSTDVHGNVDSRTAEKIIARDGELPLELDEMQASVDSMLFVIGTIPERYIRYNAILARNIEKARKEVERLQVCLHKTEERYKSKTSVLSPGIQKALIYYHMLNVLVNCWNSVWIKFGPSMRSYHPTDVRHGEALLRAENFLNTFHSWRRIMDSDKQLLLEKEVLTQRTYSPALLFRNSKNYRPPYIHLASFMESSPLHPITYVPPSKFRNEFMDTRHAYEEPTASMRNASGKHISSPAVVGYAEKEALTRFRRIFVGTLAKTGVYRDHEINRLLEELLQFQGPNLNDENLVVDFKFPTHYVRQQIKKEFHLNEWMDEALGKESGTAPASKQTKMVSQECQTETRGGVVSNAIKSGNISSRKLQLATKAQLSSKSSLMSRPLYEPLYATSSYRNLRHASDNSTLKFSNNESMESLNSAVKIKQGPFEPAKKKNPRIMELSKSSGAKPSSAFIPPPTGIENAGSTTNSESSMLNISAFLAPYKDRMQEKLKTC